MSHGYFKKVDSAVAVYISTGEKIQFEAVSWELGVYPPEGKRLGAWLADQLRDCIRRGVGGMTEITQAEYEELLAKKKTDPAGLLRPWRDEFKINVSAEKMLEAQKQQPTPTPTTDHRVPVAAVAVSMDNRAEVVPPPSAPTVGPTGEIQPPNVPSIPKPTTSKPKPAR